MQAAGESEEDPVARQRALLALATLVSRGRSLDMHRHALAVEQTCAGMPVQFRECGNAFGARQLCQADHTGRRGVPGPNLLLPSAWQGHLAPACISVSWFHGSCVGLGFRTVGSGTWVEGSGIRNVSWCAVG